MISRFRSTCLLRLTILLAAMALCGSPTAQEREEEDNRIRRLGDSLVTDPSSDWIPTAPASPSSDDLTPILEAARAAVENGQWFGDNGAFRLYQTILLTDPASEAARQESSEIRNRVLDEAQQWVNEGRHADALRSLQQLEIVAGGGAKMQRLRAQAQAALNLQQARGEMDRRMESGSLSGPQGAIAFLGQLRAFGESEATLDLLSRRLSEALAADVESILATPDADTRDTVMRGIREAEAAGLSTVQAFDQLFLALDTATADQRLADAQIIADAIGDLTGDASYARGIRLMRLKQRFPIGSVVQDDDRFPRVVVIDSPSRFAVGQSEVSVAQFSAFIDATGFVTDAQRNGMSLAHDTRSAEMVRARGVHWIHDFRGEPADADMPVIHVSYADAVAYTQWLSGETGATYRLPTTLEYLAAASVPDGQENWWGDGSPDGEWENLAGERDRYSGGMRWPRPFPNYGDGYWGPAPVASFTANTAGVYDIQGNVMEWSSDCVPADDCTHRAVVGGGWNTTPDETRARTQVPMPADTASAMIGFRVVRELQ